MPVDVGSVYFQVEMDNSSMLAAIQKMKTDLSGTKGETTLFSASLSQASKSGNALVGALTGLGGVLGVGALARFASEAPAVAGAMAEMQVKMMEFKMTLGEAFAPAFELASSVFSGFVNFLVENAPAINSIVGAICTNISTGLDLIGKFTTSIATFLENHAKGKEYMTSSTESVTATNNPADLIAQAQQASEQGWVSGTVPNSSSFIDWLKWLYYAIETELNLKDFTLGSGAR
jgi:hypothetical protein